ncbi:GNAT family N-acetyltransferase [Clostridium formicaceticum]|nr:GNAT family N-acetyltransferase [Clostridium formicaceticum]
MVIRELQQTEKGIFDTQKEGSKVFVIEKEGTTIGYIEMLYDEDRSLLRILNLWVLPQYQRKGIAKKLVKASKGYARFEKAEGIIVEVKSDNNPAIAFFQKEDFKIWSEETSKAEEERSVFLGFRFEDIYR